jgi:3-mercaptopyruvate sulfurtransferase SseA
VNKPRNKLALDLLLLTGISAGLGLTHLGLRSDMDWVAQPTGPRAEACSVDEEAPLVQRIAVEDAIRMVGEPGVSFVDARAADAFVAGHIPGAMSLPAAEAAGILEVQSVPIPPDDLVITYCDTRACERAEYLGLLLRDRAGCQQVRVLAGGWKAWLDAAAPVDGGASDG